MATCNEIPVASEAKGETRRSLFIALIFTMWSTIVASLTGVASAYLLAAPKSRKQESWIDVGDISKLAPDQPVEMVFRRNREDGWKVVTERLTAWVVKTKAEGIVAFGPQCTHLGCAYHWEDAKGQFVCPCHTSLFSLAGEVTAGPAPRPLDRYEAKLEGSRLLLGGLSKNPKGAA